MCSLMQCLFQLYLLHYLTCLQSPRAVHHWQASSPAENQRHINILLFISIGQFHLKPHCNRQELTYKCLLMASEH